MFKSWIATDGERMVPAVIRSYTLADIDGLIEVQRACFPPPYPPEMWWNAEQIREHVTRFPEGALCVEMDGRIVGSMTGLRRNLDHAEKHDWASVTDEGYIRNHEPGGDTLYIVDIGVMPEYRRFGLGRWLMQSMYETVVQLGCRRLLGAGRMPEYHLVADRLSPEAYLEEVVRGDRKDPVVTFLLKNGRTPVGVVRNYLDDEESGNNAALMEWRNPFLTRRGEE